MAAYSGAPNAVDFSFDRISGANLKAHGIDLAARYLSHTTGKNLTRAEANDLRSHGVAVLLNWESSAGRPLLGASAGAQDGRDAAALAESIGAPHGCTIYYSCDRDVSSSQFDTIAAYYRAAGQASAGRYGVGIYGEYDVIEAMHARGVTRAEWQCFAWSGDRLSVQADLYQFRNGQSMNGAAVDYDHIIHAEQLGAWWPDGHQINTPEDDSMSAADVAALSDKMERVQANLLGVVGDLKTQITSLHHQLDSEDDARAAEVGRLVKILINGDSTRKSLYEVLTSLATAVNDGDSGVLVRVAALQNAVAALGTAGVDMDAISALVTAAATSGASQGAREALNGATIQVAN